MLKCRSFRSVGEIDGEPESELTRVDRIMGEGEIIASEKTLIHMAPYDEEPGLLYLGLNICVGDSKVADLHRISSLNVELHSGRLVGESFVPRVIVAVYTYLHSQHLECFKVNEHIAV